MQLLAGTDAGTGVRGHIRVWGKSAVQPHSLGGVMGGRRGTHTGTHTGTYTQMLHLPFSDLPLKTCPKTGSFVTGSFRQALATRSSSARQTFVSIVFVFAILGKVFVKRSPNVCQKLPIWNVPV